MMFLKQIFRFKIIVIVLSFSSFSSEANEGLKSLVTSTVKYLPIDQIKNSELGLYRGVCIDQSGKSISHDLIIGKHKSLASGALPFGYGATPNLSLALSLNRPVSVVEDLYADGVYQHYVNGTLVHETFTSPNLELLAIKVSGETMSTTYTSSNGLESKLSLAEENNQRFFLVEATNSKNASVTCRTDYLVRQFYKGLSVEYINLTDSELQFLYNIASPIYTLFGGIDSSGLNPQGFGVIFSSHEGKHSQSCSWSEEGIIDSCSNVDPKWTIQIEPGVGVKLTSFKSGFALDSNGTLLYSIDSFKVRTSTINKNYFLNDLMPIPIFNNYKIIDFEPYHKDRLCVLTTDKEVLCTDGLVGLKLNQKYGFINNPILKSLGNFPTATQLEYKMTIGGSAGNGSAEEILFIKDNNGNIIQQFENIRRLLR